MALGGADDADVVIVGSGINSLVAAALLARWGRRVLVLERNDRFGGCIRTDEVTRPGFKHDVLSGFYPLFVASPGYGQLADALASHRVVFRNTDVPTGVLLPDGRATVLSSDRQANIDRMERISPGDGKRYGQSLANVTLVGHSTGGWCFRRFVDGKLVDAAHHDTSFPCHAAHAKEARRRLYARRAVRTHTPARNRCVARVQLERKETASWPSRSESTDTRTASTSTATLRSSGSCATCSA